MTDFKFEPTRYGLKVATILGDGQRLMPLNFGSPFEPMRSQLASINIETDFGKVIDHEAALACLAGLWLYYDFESEAHQIAQDLHTNEGSAWHAVIHRREPDAWNSQYWWSRVRQADWIETVKKHYPEYRSPKDFVSWVEKTKDKQRAQEIQLFEWQCLFDWCYCKSVGR